MDINHHRGRRMPRRLAALAIVAMAAVFASAGVAYAGQVPGNAAPPPKIGAAPGSAHTCHRVSASATECLIISHTTVRRISQNTRPQPGGTPTRHPAAADPTPPPLCGFKPTRFNAAYVYSPDRFTACVQQPWTFQVVVIATDGTVNTVGSFQLIEEEWFSYASNSTTWTHGVVLVPYNATGDLAGGLTITLSSTCGVNAAYCISSPSSGPLDTQFVTIPPYRSGALTKTWTEMDAGLAPFQTSVVDRIDKGIGMAIDWLPPAGTIPLQGTVTDNFLTSGMGRCDSVIGSTAGCVNQNNVPTLWYDSIRNPLVGPVAVHIWQAQNYQLHDAWGEPGHPLTRDMNQSDIDLNRKIACSSFVPQDQVNTSCDEYPLASTYQGANFNPEFSVAGVPPSANSSQGGLTSAFYNSNRMIDGDTFYVNVIRPDGTVSW